MLKNIWSILCARSIIDKETNNISIYDALEQLEVEVKIKNNEGIPVAINLPIEYEVVGMWLRENTEKEIKAELIIELFNPKGKIIKTFNQSIEMPAKMKRLRSRLRIKGFTVEMPGGYLFKVKIKEADQVEFRVVSELPLEVHIKKTTINN
jgi:hypothetical protein